MKSMITIKLDETEKVYREYLKENGSFKTYSHKEVWGE